MRWSFGSGPQSSWPPVVKGPPLKSPVALYERGASITLPGEENESEGYCILEARVRTGSGWS